jgi:curved DNA-binding protein CbpA
MVLRIVSGVLVPKSSYQNSGDVTIELKSNSIVDGSHKAWIMDGCTYGGTTHYDNEPCKAISIRSFGGQPDSINLNDDFQNNYKEVVIGWNCNGGKITAITYFFAGEE